MLHHNFDNYLLAATPLKVSVFTGTISLHILDTLILFSSQFSKLFSTLDEFGGIVTVFALIFKNFALWDEIFTLFTSQGNPRVSGSRKLCQLMSQKFHNFVSSTGVVSLSMLVEDCEPRPASDAFITVIAHARSLSVCECAWALSVVGDSEEFCYKILSIVSPVVVSACAYRR